MPYTGSLIRTNRMLKISELNFRFNLYYRFVHFQNTIFLKLLFLRKWQIMPLLLILFISLGSCKKETNEDDRVHVLDKKYISESELFALNKAIDEEPEDAENYFKRSKVYFGRNENQKA